MRRRRERWGVTLVALGASLALGGCWHVAGTGGHSMAASEHERAAADAEREATQHRDHHYASRDRRPYDCDQELDIICWRELPDSNDLHLRRAADLRAAAARHRAESQALRDAEAQHCKGVSDRDRNLSPLLHYGDILRVAADPVADDSHSTTVTIYYRDVSGLTENRLRDLVACHSARAATLGYANAEMGPCPLAIRGITATVLTEGVTLAVRLRAGSTDARRELLRRALVLSEARARHYAAEADATK